MEMDEMPPEEQSAVERRTRPFQVIPVTIGVVVLAVIAGVLFWQQGKSAKAESVRMAGVGAAYLEKGDRVAARACLSSAVILDPENAEAQRLLNSLGEDAMVEVPLRGANGEEGGGGVAKVVPVPQEIPKTPQVVPEKLEPSPRLDPALVESHLKRAEELLAKKDEAGAEAALKEAVAVDISDRSKRVLAKFLMDRPLDAERVPELLELLREVGKSQTVEGAAALSTALIKGMVPAEEVASWVTLIRAHPHVTMPMLLAVDRVDAQLRPREKSEVAAAAVKRVEGSVLVDRAAVLQWLSEIGEAGQGLNLVKLEEVAADRVMLEVWIQARAAAGDWAAVLQAAEAAGNPLTPNVVKLLRGRAMSGMGKVKEGRELCREVVKEAAGDRKRLIEALSMLAGVREQELFEEELAKALENPDAAEAIVAGVSPAVYRTRDAIAVRRLYEIAAESPVLRDSVTVKSMLSHYRLMLGMEEDIVELATRMERHVDDPLPRVTLALAMLNLGDRVRALSELEERKPDLDVTSLGVSQQAVVAAVLAANFRRDEALGMVARMPMQMLTELEAEWLRGYLDGDIKARYRMQKLEPEAEPKWKETARRVGVDGAIVVGLFLVWKVYMRMRYGRMVKD
jgi:tetratricopeptide (TPR) repeat protein